MVCDRGGWRRRPKTHCAAEQREREWEREGVRAGTGVVTAGRGEAADRVRREPRVDRGRRAGVAAAEAAAAAAAAHPPERDQAVQLAEPLPRPTRLRLSSGFPSTILMRLRVIVGACPNRERFPHGRTDMRRNCRTDMRARSCLSRASPDPLSLLGGCEYQMY